MAVQNRLIKGDARSRTKHSRLLKNKLSPAPEKDVQPPVFENDIRDQPAMPVAESSQQLKQKKYRQAVEVEQALSHHFGPRKPVLEITLKLTTALRGKRQQDGLAEGGYMFRLEVLKTSPDLKLAGFQLGPWKAENLEMEPGAIFLHPPLWAGFQAKTGTVKGRLLLKDMTRHRLVDLPWKTEAVVPGPEPMP